MEGQYVALNSPSPDLKTNWSLHPHECPNFEIHNRGDPKCRLKTTKSVILPLPMVNTIFFLIFSVLSV